MKTIKAGKLISGIIVDGNNYYDGNFLRIFIRMMIDVNFLRMMVDVKFLRIFIRIKNGCSSLTSLTNDSTEFS